MHDLRDTFITIAESLDIPGLALRQLTNHKDPNDVRTLAGSAAARIGAAAMFYVIFSGR